MSTRIHVSVGSAGLVMLNPAGHEPVAWGGRPTVQVSPVSAAFGTQASNLMVKLALPFCGIERVDGSIAASTFVSAGPMSAA